MKLSEISNKLNYNIELNGKENANFLQFYSGEFLTDAASLMKELAPSSKVAVIGLKEDYEKTGKPFAESLKKNGIRPISVLLAENSLNINVLSKMFNLAEDVRLVVCLSSALLPFAFYFAHYRKIDVVCGATDVEFFKNFYFRFFVKDGNKIDYVYAPAKTHVILDEQLLTSVSCAESYAFTMSKLPSVFDYETAKRIKGDNSEVQILPETEGAFFNLLVTSIKSAYNVFNLNKDEQESYLLYYALSVLVANAMVGGTFIDFSAPKGLEFLLSKEDFNGHALLYGTSVMLTLYSMVLSEKYKNLLEQPDYIERAYALKEFFGCDEKQFLEGLKQQIELLECFGTFDFSKIAEIFTVDENTIFDVGDNLINTYHVLGGNQVLDKEAVVRALNKAGDLPEFFNLISVCRDKGLLELMIDNLE